jgi:hypothetical protein
MKMVKKDETRLGAAWNLGLNNKVICNSCGLNLLLQLNSKETKTTSI